MPAMVLVGGAALAAGTAGALFVLARERRRLELPFAPDELHWARTSDGWRLPMGRYLPKVARVSKEPVILCHGMGANRYNLDLNERHSVARFLAARGFECWVVELRGSGITHRESSGRRHYRFTFDDYITGDLPALIAKAKEVSATERVLWVGHSKGGIVMYAYCGLQKREDVAGVVAIGSPAGFPHFSPLERSLLSRGHHLLLHDGVYTEPFLRWLAPLGGRGLLPMHYMARQENMDPEMAGWAMANLLGNVSRAVLVQFARWIRTGELTSFDGSIDYRKGLEKSEVPFLLIAGSRDLLVAPAAVELARDAMVAARARGAVEYVIAGRETGFREDYGHGDLVLGRHAPDEIFPRIEAWLRARATPP
ncbi:MAG TPA: alpha/beta fold hydrolase [bacterium]|nr:alpha/beta fold hydrolase [bacterium]